MDRYNYEDGVGQPVKRVGKQKATDKKAAALAAEAAWRNRPKGVQGGVASEGGMLLMNATREGSPTLLTNRYSEPGKPFTTRRVELTSGHIRWLIIDPWGNRLWQTASTQDEADDMVRRSNAQYGLEDTPW
jgi:hypothetical protein